MVSNLIREPNYQSSLTIAKAWRLQASKMRNMVTPALEHQKGNSLSFTLESVLNIVWICLYICTCAGILYICTLEMINSVVFALYRQPVHIYQLFLIVSYHRMYTGELLLNVLHNGSSASKMRQDLLVYM